MKPSEYLSKKAEESGIIYPKITVSEALELNNKANEQLYQCIYNALLENENQLKGSL